jgi:hypothetical protein
VKQTRVSYPPVEHVRRLVKPRPREPAAPRASTAAARTVRAPSIRSQVLAEFAPVARRLGHG